MLSALFVLPGILARVASEPRSGAQTLTASFSLEVDGHISKFMSLFLAEELNREWSDRLRVQRAVSTREYGELVYQTYELPWPLSPRELLMRCDRVVSHRAHTLTSTCSSVQHSSVPKNEHAVRIELQNTQWVVSALPGERTRFELSIELPATAAANVPAFIVRYCQRSMLLDSMKSFLEANQRLQLPAHRSFIGWQRTRDVSARARADAGGARPQAVWEVYSFWTLLLAMLVAALWVVVQGALQGGVLACCKRLGAPLSMPQRAVEDRAVSTRRCAAAG